MVKIHTLLLALMLVGCLVSTSAAYDLPANGTGILQNVRRPDLCLSNTGPGQVGLANCDLTSPTQNIWIKTWLANPANRVLQFTRADPGTGQLAAVAGDSMNDGALIFLDTANPPNYPRWNLVNGGSDGVFQLNSTHSGKCLTAEGMGPLQGTGPGSSYLDQWTCTSQTHQYWRFIQAPNVPYYPALLKSAAQPINCLDNFGANPDNDAPTGLYLCTPSAANQQWFMDVTDVTAGLYLLRNRATNKCLKVHGEVASNGGTVNMYDCPDPASAPTQFIWNPVPAAADPDVLGNRWWFENMRNPGQCLNIGLFFNSQLWDCSTATNQYFIFQHPMQYLKTAGSLCGGPKECLSDSCSLLLLCDQGAATKPCQTKADCVSGVCYNGNCN